MSGSIPTVPSSQAKPLRIGLIGVTGYAFAYFEEINKLVKSGNVEWGAVTIINQEEALEQVAFFKSSGVPIYDSYEHMLESERGRLDWVCIPTAISWHAQMTVDALSCGFPVLLEKPMAPTLQDVDQIQTAEKESGLPVSIGYQHNYCGATWEIKQLLLDGYIGEIEQIDSICLWPRSHFYYNRNNWAGRLFVNGSWVLDSPLHNAISHILNLILFFAGSSLDKRADINQVEAELYRAKPIQSYDTVRTRAMLDTGPDAVVLLSHSTSDVIDPQIRITGSKGTLHWSFQGEHVFEVGGARKTIKAEDPVQVREEMFQNILKFMQGDPSARVCSTDQARGEVKWVNAVHDAAAIHDIPAEYCRTFEDSSGEVFDVVNDLDIYAKRAYAERCWLADAGAPWAVPPGKLDVRDYKAFEARNIRNLDTSVPETLA